MSFVSVTTPESGIVRDGLLYWINPSLASSYSGSGTTIYDLSGNDYDSSLQSGAGFSADNGGVFSTNGSSSWIKLENNFLGPTEFNANAHYTISMWFRTVGDGGGMLLGQSNNATIGAANSYIAAIYVGTDGILRTFCLDEPSNGRTTVDISDLRDNKWHNVVVTFAGTGAGAHKTYVDGVLKGSVTKSGYINYGSTYYYTVGGGKATGWVGAMSNNFWFNGNIGDFKYYNRALTDIEVLQNFRAMAPRYGLLYYDIVQDDLLFNIDSFYPPSYGGSGTVLTDTVKGLTVDFDGAVATGYGISPYTTPNGWDFNGSNATEYVNQNSSDFEFQYGDSFSVEAVVYVNENANSGYIVSNRQIDASGVHYSGWTMLQDVGKIHCFIGGYPSSSYDWRRIAISTTDFNAHVYQKWSHIVWSNDGTIGGSKLYINGVDRTNSSSDDATPPYTINYDSDFKLGFAADTSNASSVHPFDGNISACRVYNKNLSSDEVRRNYNAVANNYGLVPLPLEQLVLTYGRSTTVVGDVESGIYSDGATIYNGWSTGALLFYDATKDGTWSDDGNGLLWNQVDATTISNWAGYLGTGGGMFKIYETGTKTLIFSYEYSGYRTWAGNSKQYGQFSKDYTGVVPGYNQRVDVYHIPV